MTSSAPVAFRPHSRGYELHPEEFGFLTDSLPHLGDISLLRQKIEEDGYLFLRGFFKREDVLAARQIILDRLMNEGFLDKNYPVSEGIVADVKVVNQKSAFNSSPHGGQPVKAYHPDDLTQKNQPLDDLLNQGRIIRFFEEFFGAPVYRFNYTWFRAVGRGMGTPPHCDWVYMGRGTSKLFTTWIPIGDTPLDVGGLMILENSHKKADRLQNYLSRDVDDYCTNHPKAEKIESGELLFEWDGVLTKNPLVLPGKLGGRWLTAEYEAGDLLIFTMRTIHASLDNQSNRIRISVDTRYQPADEPIDERWSAENAQPYAREFKRGRIC